MTERKAVIKNADMSEEMQQDAIDCAAQAMVLTPLSVSPPLYEYFSDTKTIATISLSFSFVFLSICTLLSYEHHLNWDASVNL